MMSWIWGTVMFLAVASVTLSVVLWISRALFGKTVTAILLALSLLWAAWCGWVWLIHNDHLALQVLGWALVGLAAFFAYVGVEMLRDRRATRHVTRAARGV